MARISDRAFVLRHIEGLGVVLAPTADAEERLGEVRAEIAPLLERLDGRRTLKEAVALTRLDEFEAAKVACGLLFLGVVKRAEPGGTGAPAPEEFDLAAAAQEAFGGDEVRVDQPALSAPAAASAEFTPDIPFFVPDSEPFPAVTAAVEAEVAPMAEVSGFAAADDTPAFVPMAGGDVMSPPAFARQQETDPILHQDPMTMAPPPAGQGSAPFGFAAAEPEPSLGAPPMFDAPPSFDIPKLDLSSAPAEGAPVEEAFDMDTLPRGIPTSSAAMPSFQMDGPSSTAHHEDEDGPMTTPAARPSKEDLAALDALLNPSSSSVGRVQPAARPDRDRWEPQFRPPAARRPAARKRSVPIMPLALGVAGFAVARPPATTSSCSGQPRRLK